MAAFPSACPHVFSCIPPDRCAVLCTPISPSYHSQDMSSVCGSPQISGGQASQCPRLFFLTSSRSRPVAFPSSGNEAPNHRVPLPTEVPLTCTTLTQQPGVCSRTRQSPIPPPEGKSFPFRRLPLCTLRRPRGKPAVGPTGKNRRVRKHTCRRIERITERFSLATVIGVWAAASRFRICISVFGNGAKGRICRDFLGPCQKTSKSSHLIFLSSTCIGRASSGEICPFIDNQNPDADKESQRLHRLCSRWAVERRVSWMSVRI